MDALSLDQMLVFVEAVESGSFSAAGKRLNRAQTAITYSVRKLEEQVGSPLFDRSSYRPQLTEIGRQLLPRVRQVLHDVGQLRARIHELSSGIEPHLDLLLADGLPMAPLVEPLKAFGQRFPAVELRLRILPFSLETGARAPGLAKGIGHIRILFETAFPDDIAHAAIATASLITVVAPGHPLLAAPGPVDERTLAAHTHIVLSERIEAVQGLEHRVLVGPTWRVTDQALQYRLILGGLGWGSLPDLMIADDLKAGRLVEIPQSADSRYQRLRMPRIVAVCRRDEPLGPAGQWLFEALATSGS